MKYCRYCAYRISGDCFYCTCKEIELKRIDRVTNCKEFVLSEMGDVETGKQYKPRSKKRKTERKRIPIKAFLIYKENDYGKRIHRTQRCT